MESKRQRKRIDYARMSRTGLEDATFSNQQTYLPCTSCNRKLSTPAAFLVHINSCSKEPHNCPLCQDTNDINNDSKELTLTLNGSEEDKDNSDIITKKAENTRGRFFTSVDELDKHISEEHPKTLPFTCWVCDVEYRSLYVLQKHLLHDHRMFPSTRYESKKITFRCTGCQNLFNDGTKLANHYKNQKECAGLLHLWHCVDPQQDAENDISITLRECQAIEKEFLTRFPRSRIGFDFSTADFYKVKNISKKDSSPKTLKQKLQGTTTTPTSSTGRVRIPVVKFSEKTPSVKSPVKSQSATKKSQKTTPPKKQGKSPLTKVNGPPKIKFIKKVGVSKKPGITKASKAAKKTTKKYVAKTPKKRGLPSPSAPETGITEDTAVISPKRRRMSSSPVAIAVSGQGAAGEDDLDEVLSSPEAPFGVPGASPGLEPEGDEDEENGEQITTEPLTQIKVLNASCDLDEDDDDERAAPAIEMNVCRACGIALDSFSEYTSHMQQVHNLILQSPPPPGRGRPSFGLTNSKSKKSTAKGDSENDASISGRGPAAKHKMLYDAHVRQHVRLTHPDTVASLKVTKPKGKRGRKPKKPKDDDLSGDSPSAASWSDALAAAPLALLCPLCPDHPSFSSSDAREAHLASEHDGERAFGCQACGETFSLFYELQLHTRQEHDVGGGPPAMIEDPARANLAYKCVVCKVGFHDETILQRHYDAMHTLDEGEQYHCPVCYFTYSGCRTRDDHVIKKHPDARAFKCPVCEARFASFEVFRAHEKRAHISQKTRMRSGLSAAAIESSPNLLSLAEKPKKTPRRKLAAAMRGALGERSNNDSVEALAQKRRESRVYKEGTLYCEKCNEDCANEEELDIHTKEHVRKEKRFGCTQCGRVFSGALARSFLVDHIKLEHMHQAPYNCDDCGQRFLYKIQFDRHRTVDRDSGVASCRRAEDLSIVLPRLVFGCSRCAKIFAGEGAQSRYSEHQLECVGSPPVPGPSAQRQRPNQAAAQIRKDRPMTTSVQAGIVRPVKDSCVESVGIRDSVDVIPGAQHMVVEAAEDAASSGAPAVRQQDMGVDSDSQGAFSNPEDPDSGLIAAAADERLHHHQQQEEEEVQHDLVPTTQSVDPQLQQQTVIVLPSGADGVASNGGEDGEGEQVMVLPEDVLSNVRAAAAAGLGDDSSVVLIQAEDGTLIVASEQQLAELQMQEEAAEAAAAAAAAAAADQGMDVDPTSGRTVRELLAEKRLREANLLEDPIKEEDDKSLTG